MSSSQSKENRDLAPKRLDRIREVIRQERVVRISDLCRQIGVSAATIRRDLNRLEELGEVRRVHGGVVGIESRLEEPLFEDKASFRVVEKRRIADKALDFIEQGDTVFLDGGSTVLELARMLRDRNNLTILTNSIRALLELAGRGPDLIFVGGELRRISQTIVGPLTRLMLEQMQVDRAFMGTMGMTMKEGLTTTDPGEAYTKELVTKTARQVILLADSSKIGKISFVQASRIDEIDIVITDKPTDRQFLNQLKKKQIEVLTV